MSEVLVTNSSLLNTTTGSDQGQFSGVGIRLQDLPFLVFCLLLALVIICGNSLVMVAYRANSRLRTKANLFLVSLAVSDCLVGVAALPLWILINVLRIPSSSAFHILFISFDIFSALTSVFHLTAISVERFVAVSRPLHYASLSFRYYKLTIIIAWLSSALIAALYRIAQISNYMSHYVPFLLCMGFLGPLFIIASMYCKIFNIARMLILKDPGEEIALARAQCRQSAKSVLRRERKVAVTVSIITGLFFCAWLPFWTVLMISFYCGPGCFYSNAAMMGTIAFSKWMHYGNSAVNAFVYAFRDREMRRTFARILGKRCGNRCFQENVDEIPSTYL
ncbi:predicted protein [Nematostella vectensis]|uniref:G-protein coupled receptors family 1 profile domain-containing protein n=1 Tax=Nematostella vectensis TaxID=45351 RepID=A7SHS8_NEMVE|nr:octopamine receptor beta-3R [Nematostella vectensis]EDO36788.1 predicted protein [Nematostella vectensis]|eukprot:XP_001628851.1 predicted protein [Nematostella vectensis]